MKKIFFILIILAVLLLSGCDAMLEAFYPEFADNFDGSNNVFAVEYNYTADDMLTNGYQIGTPLKVELYRTGETPNGTNQPIASIEVYDEYSYYYEFFVPSGSYDVWIWQDNYNNGVLGAGDFVLSPDINAIPPNYNFTGSEEYWYYYGSLWDNVSSF